MLFIEHLPLSWLRAFSTLKRTSGLRKSLLKLQLDLLQCRLRTEPFPITATDRENYLFLAPSISNVLQGTLSAFFGHH